MAKTCRPWAPTQTLLFPPSPREWLGKDHAVYFLLDVVQQLDLSEVEAVLYGGDPRGTLPYHPRMMTALLLYGYCVGIRSSRKLERATYEDLRFRVLAGGQHPDHTRISEFRRKHLKALKGLFVPLCAKIGETRAPTEISVEGDGLNRGRQREAGLPRSFGSRGREA